MMRSRYYGSVMPIAGIVYVIVMFATGFNTTVVIIGALAFALIALMGAAMFRAEGGGRQRNRNRYRG